MAKDDTFKGEKLALRWRGPRRVVKVISDWIFKVEDLRNGTLEDIHSSRLRYYCDSSLNEEAILPHVLYSETGMPVSRLMGLERTDKGLMVHVR